MRESNVTELLDKAVIEHRNTPIYQLFPDLLLNS